MSEALQLASTYFELADEAATDAIRHSWEETGWMVLLSWADKQTASLDHLARECWPDGSVKSGGAFTAHIEQPRSSLDLGGAKRGPKYQTKSRFHQDAHKAEISYV
jgi:hypothetical protein